MYFQFEHSIDTEDSISLKDIVGEYFDVND